jgi:DNA-binding GntR family transcriptional regulator
MIVELRGLERAVGSDEVRHDRALLEPLRDQWRAMWTDRPSPDPQFVDVDEDFHVTLLRSSGNHALTEILVGANARIRPIRMYDFITADRIETTISQHLQIVDAVLAGQLPEAIRALRRHVGESMEVPHAEPVIEARDLRLVGRNSGAGLRGLDLAVRAGEILGVAGVAGNGQRELADLLEALRRALTRSG